MGTIKGLDCDFMINTGTYASATWVEVGAVVNVTIDDELTEVDASRRSSGGWREMVTTLRDMTVNVDVIKDIDDPGFLALFAAATDKTPIEIAIVDGDNTVDGTDYVNFMSIITQWNKPQELEGVVQIAAVFRPTPDPDIVPTFDVTPLPTTRPPA